MGRYLGLSAVSLVAEKAPQKGNIIVPAPPGELRASPHKDIDAALAAAAARRDAWVSLGISARIELLSRMIQDTEAVAARWVEAECDRKGIAVDSPAAGEEWFLGPAFMLRNLRLLRSTLGDIEREGRPRLPGRVRPGSSGQALARIFPGDVYDRLFFVGVTGDVWMPPGVAVEEVEATLGGIYRTSTGPGRVCAVLGAGNVSSIPPNDVLYKLFAEDQVVVLKLNPLTEHLGPLFAEAMRPLIEGGYVRIVYGGAEEAAYLLHHDAVDAVHMTGSDKTYDAIVFGPGAEGARRKGEHRPLLDKPVTAELGNVTPAIVVPGPWSSSDTAYQAALLATMFAHGAGYECINARVLLTHRGWDGRARLLDELRRTLRDVPNRLAFYPGAQDRYETFVHAHPEAEQLGAGAPGTTPWALIPGVEPDPDDIVFTTDPFTCVLSESALEARSVADFVDQATDFCNESIWGTLGVSLIVHPDSLRDEATASAVERAVAGLRYGMVTVNTGPALGFALTSPPWGAFPGHAPHDIQSGRGVVHNTYLFARPEKTVLRSPFRAFPPRPPWLVTHRRQREALSRVTYLEAARTPAKLPAILWHTLRGMR